MFKNINVEEAKKMIENEKGNHNFVILDVRTKGEFEIKNLDGALNIDIYDSDFSEQVNKLDKNKTYLVHCKAGGRSEHASQIMQNLGFNKLYNVNGFIFNE